MMIRVSIITIVYNGEKTIEHTIKSVINEKKNNTNIEYIIIDGQSTDRTNEIICKYDKDIDVYISEKDNGIHDAINKAIKLCTGDYYIVLAADDQLLPNAIQEFRESLKDNIDVWCGSIICYVNGYYMYKKSKICLDELYRCCSLMHPATFFKKERIESVGYYDNSFKVAGDRDIFLRLYVNGAKFQIENIPITLFAMDGVSVNNHKLAMEEDYKLCVRYGMTDKEACENINNMSESKIRKLLKKVLVKIHMYKFVACLLGKSSNFVTREELDKYKLS